MSKCFISHANKDRQFVEREIIGFVHAIGIETWYSKDDIVTSEQWERSILSGLKSSDWFILVMSTSAAHSEWVKDEISWAIKHSPGRIIPILIDDCKKSDFHIRLDRIQHIDFRGHSAEGRQKLIGHLVDAEYRPIRRASAIIGKWSGTVHQNRGPEGQPLDYPCCATLTVTQQEIKGHFTTEVLYEGEMIKMDFDVTGNLTYERFLQVNHSSKDQGVIQFGSMIFELDSAGRRMKGKYIGYGALSESIVAGTAVFTKEDHRDKE